MSIATERSTPFLYLATDREGKHSGDDDIWPIRDTLLIGRENADVTLNLPALSRRHASVQSDQYGCRINDLDSKNGTAVNGAMLSDDSHTLSHGDSIVLAGIVELLFHDPNATPVAPRLGKLRGLWIDSRTKDVWIDAQKLTPPLSSHQQNLLELLVEADGRLVNKVELIDRLWPNRTIDTISMDAVDSLIKRLRRRLSSVEHDEPVLEVHRGLGIRLRSGR